MGKRSFKKAFKEADNYYTPSILVEALITPLYYWTEDFKRQNNRDPVIWCPFDEEHSKYVQILRKYGYKVVYSHINYGQDFFDYEPEEWDIAISNPPFSCKLEVFARLHKLNKPFVMLMNMMAINYQEIGNLFYNIGSQLQFIIPDKKVSFDGHTSSFCSGYVCYKFVSCTQFVHLENNNSGDYFKE